MTKFKVRFLPMDRVVEVDTEVPVPGHDGEPGSLLRIALANGIELDHACGGVCACSTCHVIVREGGESLPPAEEDEEDQLDNARGLTLHSRLSCQAVPRGDRDLVIEIPQWNRNLTKEGPH
jgi:2Fe-2S ferredoxin